MKRDTTRDTFEPRRHYSSVRQQQGRVQLDSEWNEQADIVGHRIETETVDVVGACGVPIDAAGFDVEPTPGGGEDLILSPGRAYVDGILCQIDPPELPITAIQSGGTLLRLVPGSLAGVRLEADDWVEVFTDRNRTSGTRGTWTRVTTVDRANDRVRVADSVAAHNPFPNRTVRRLPTYSDQDDRPAPVPLPASPADDGTYLAYLDVWRRHVGALEDPSIREVALGGPDTATREQVLCQVRLLQWEGADVDEPPHCLDRPQAWLDTIAASTGRLRARTRPVPPAPDPCEVPPGGGYTRLENQHYRVEVHIGGDRDDVELKWSRDNGSMVTAWLDQDPAEPEKLTVESAGRDTVHALASGQWIELTDDDRELEGRSGVMVKILRVDDDVVTLDPVSPAVDFTTFGTNPKVRRWDMPGGLISGSGGWIDLEGGIQVQLQVGEYQVGDYWRIPARAYIGERLGDIEWPRDAMGEPASQLPDGVEHHFCKLALLELAGGVFTKLSDCRPQFPPLTDLIQLDMAGGDGQEAMPGDTLPCPLSVVVRNGSRPIEGRRVLFEVEGGDGTLSELFAGPPISPTLEVTTSDSGTASVFWTLPGAIAVGRQCFRVTASLLDAAGNIILPRLTFHSSQSIARQVQFEPSHCTGLLDAPEVETVQEGLDALWCNPSLTMIGGQGQQGAPGEQLPCALRVAVRNGRWPVFGQRVRFGFVHVRKDGSGMIEEKNGKLIPRDPSLGEGEAVLFADDDKIITTTGGLGVTTCFWILPEEVETPRRCLRVWAHLVDEDEKQIGPYVVFNADQVLPAEVEDEGIRVTNVLVTETGQAVGNDSVIDFDDFAPQGEPAGLIIELDRDLEPETLTDTRRKHPIFAPRPNLEVEVGIPWRYSSQNLGLITDAPMTIPVAAGDLPDLGIAGFIPFTLNGETVVEGSKIAWTPTLSAQFYLASVMSLIGEWGVDRLRVRLKLDGNYLWEQGSAPPVYLDGEGFGRLAGERLATISPSGNRQAGGTFHRWFWIRQELQGPPSLDLSANGGNLSVAGIVRDSAGSGLPGVAVALLSEDGGTAVKNTTTDGDGRFQFTKITAGTYRVRATFTGFPPDEALVTVRGFGLVEVDGIGRVTAERLEGVGVHTLDDLVASDATELAIRLNFNTDRVARFIEHARRILAGN